MGALEFSEPRILQPQDDVSGFCCETEFIDQWLATHGLTAKEHGPAVVSGTLGGSRWPIAMRVRSCTASRSHGAQPIDRPSRGCSSRDNLSGESRAAKERSGMERACCWVAQVEVGSSGFSSALLWAWDRDGDRDGARVTFPRPRRHRRTATSRLRSSRGSCTACVSCAPR